MNADSPKGHTLGMSGMSGLAHSGVPLGGLGTGSVELRGDGLFHEWQIMNNRPWGAGPACAVSPDAAFFGMRVSGCGPNRTLLLASPSGYDDYLNNPYFSPFLECPACIDAEVRFPFTRLRFQFAKKLPLHIELEAFSPFIPMETRDSSLPLAFFRVVVRNEGERALDVSVMQVVSNLTGYSRRESLSIMRPRRGGGLPCIRMERENHPSDAGDFGSIVFGALQAGPGGFVCHPRQSRDLWEPLRLTGLLDDVDHGRYTGSVGNQGQWQTPVVLRSGSPKGAVCLRQNVAPGESKPFRFCLAWHFPNMWDRDFVRNHVPASRIGHMYSNWFRDADEVFQYGAKHFDRLHCETAAFTDAYYGSSLEPWKLDAIAAQFTTLVKSSWYDEQGRFGIWEGLGCCGLQTVDITHYGSFPIVQWFPDIEKSQMRLSAAHVDEKGVVPHMMPGNFSCCDRNPKRRGRIDLIPQYVLLNWRDLLWTGDTDHARAMWPGVVKALRHFQTFDTDGDGLPNNEGPDQTYDQFPLKGTSSFVSFLYAAALRTASQTAEWLGDSDGARVYRDLLADALPKLERQLWNGRCYRLSHDPADGRNSEGVMADQLNGEWFLRQTARTGLLPETRVNSALDEILRHCVDDQHGYLANCAWPEGGGVSIGRHTADQANMPWSGVEYAVAAFLALVGRENECWAVVKRVWDRYERAGLRFNHIECGEHYYRALSSWAVYLAWAGYWWNGLDQELTVACRAPARVFVLNTPTAWGRMRLSADSLVLELRKGHLVGRTIALVGCDGTVQSVTRDGKPCQFTVSRRGDTTRVTFDPPLEISSGVGLSLAIR